MSSSASDNPFRVLVVDDDTTQRRIVAKWVQKFNEEHSRLPLNTTQAQDGQEALEIYRKRQEGKEPFHLIISDHDMPRMLGLDFLKQIVEIGGDLPFLVLRTTNAKEDLSSEKNPFPECIHHLLKTEPFHPFCDVIKEAYPKPIHEPPAHATISISTKEEEKPKKNKIHAEDTEADGTGHLALSAAPLPIQEEKTYSRKKQGSKRDKDGPFLSHRDALILSPKNPKKIRIHAADASSEQLIQAANPEGASDFRNTPSTLASTESVQATLSSSDSVRNAFVFKSLETTGSLIDFPEPKIRPQEPKKESSTLCGCWPSRQKPKAKNTRDYDTPLTTPLSTRVNPEIPEATEPEAAST